MESNNSLSFWNTSFSKLNQDLFMSREQIDQLELLEFDLLLEQQFHEQIEQQQVLSLPVKIKLYNTHLIICEDSESKEIKNAINLEMVKCYWVKKEEALGFKFNKNDQDYEIFTVSDDIYNTWKEVLRKKVIVTDFRDIYDYVKTIGQGSFSKVYKVRRKKDQKTFAAKALPKQNVKKDKDVAALINEIKMLKILGENSLLLSLLEVHDTDKYIYFVMKLAKGGILFNALKKVKRFGEGTTQILMKSLLNGLLYIHSKGIMHRDLTLENVMLSKINSYNQLRIIDFGLAAMTNEENALFKICGTPGFIAPEILRRKSKTYSEKCDIFSAGVIFYYLLTGQHPFPGIKMMTVLKRNKECKIDFKILEKQNITNCCLNLIKSMLEVDPDKRPLCADLLNHDFFLDNIEFMVYQRLQNSVMDDDLDNRVNGTICYCRIF